MNKKAKIFVMITFTFLILAFFKSNNTQKNLDIKELLKILNENKNKTTPETYYYLRDSLLKGDLNMTINYYLCVSFNDKEKEKCFLSYEENNKTLCCYLSSSTIKELINRLNYKEIIKVETDNKMLES